MHALRVVRPSGRARAASRPAAPAPPAARSPTAPNGRTCARDAPLRAASAAPSSSPMRSSAAGSSSRPRTRHGSPRCTRTSTPSAGLRQPHRRPVVAAEARATRPTRSTRSHCPQNCARHQPPSTGRRAATNGSASHANAMAFEAPRPPRVRHRRLDERRVAATADRAARRAPSARRTANTTASASCPSSHRRPLDVARRPAAGTAARETAR